MKNVLKRIISICLAGVLLGGVCVMAGAENARENPAEHTSKGHLWRMDLSYDDMNSKESLAVGDVILMKQFTSECFQSEKKPQITALILSAKGL